MAAAERTGATLRWFGITDDGRLDLSNIDELITERTKVVALTWVSNMLGTVNPVAEIARRAHEVGAVVLVDGAQAVPQMPVDVQAAGVDFLVFTDHKVTGPTGIGVLWGRRALLDQLPPFLGGGEMIATVSMERSTYAQVHRLRPAPPISSRPSVSARPSTSPRALGADNVRAHEEAITRYALEGLSTVSGLTVLGPQDVAARWRDLVRDRGRAPARREPAARQPRHRRPRRAPLREAAHKRFGVQARPGCRRTCTRRRPK